MKSDLGKENEEEDIYSQTETIMKKISEQMHLTEDALNFVDNGDTGSKSMSLPQRKKENQNIIRIKDSLLEFVNLEKKYANAPDDAPFDDFCSICSSKIYYIKYICVICRDCILCPKCEIEHEHPTLKCKFPQLSTLKDIYIYINTRNNQIKNNNNNKNNGGFLSGFFSSNYEFKLECNSCKFSMRKNSVKNVPIILNNLSGSELDLKKEKLIIFARNNKDLKVYTNFLVDKVNKNEKDVYLVKIESNDVCKVYDFTLELFSSVKMKSNVLNFKVEINEDEEDEKLNEFFIESYPECYEILIESTKIKKGVKKILEDTQNKFEILLILNCLKNNKGNVDAAYSELLNKSNN